MSHVNPEETEHASAGPWAYLLLASFVVLTACAGLYLNRRLMVIYSSSVQVNRSWSTRLQQYGELSRLSSEVFTVGLNIFDAHGGRAEVPRMVHAMEQLDQRLASSRADLAAELTRPGADTALPRLLARLDQIITAQDALNGAVGEVLHDFRQGRREAATQRAAAMNRMLSSVQRSLEELRSEVHQIQDRNVDEEQVQARSLTRFSYFIAALILVMVGGVALYGVGVSRDARRAAAARTRYLREISHRNAEMRLVLENVNQGLMTLNLDGTVCPERSAMADRWLGPLSAGTTFGDLIRRLSPDVSTLFRLGWAQLLANRLPLDLCLAQLPQRLGVGSLLLHLDYVPIFSSTGTGLAGPDVPAARLDKLLLVISDITSQVAQGRAEEEQREILAVLEKLMIDRSVFQDFFHDARDLIGAVCGEHTQDLVVVKRQIHTLKGNCAIFGLARIAALCHEIEDRMNDSGGGPSANDRAALRSAWSAFSGKLARLWGRETGLVEIDQAEHEQLMEALAAGLPPRQIMETVAAWKWHPVKGRLLAFAEQIRELALRLGRREVVVEVEADGLRLPGEQFADFWRAFTHLVRNAVDHGLEDPAEREAAGKHDQPKVVLAAWIDRIGPAHVIIEVRDNGRGIDWPKLAGKAAQRGLPHTTREDLVEALFADGVSTNDEVTELSGRGVGMAAVRAAVRDLGGQIIVDSAQGRGTTFRFRFRRELIGP